MPGRRRGRERRLDSASPAGVTRLSQKRAILSGFPSGRLHALEFLVAGALILAGPAAAQTPAQTAAPPHNVVIFVADGLRARSVNDQTAPNMAALAREGVSLANSHSLFPTFTTANASAIATGHSARRHRRLQQHDLYRLAGAPRAGGTVTPFLENDPVLGEVDAHFGGNYLDETDLLAAGAGAGLLAPRRSASSARR